MPDYKYINNKKIKVCEKIIYLFCFTSLLFSSCTKEVTVENGLDVNADDALAFIQTLYDNTNFVTTKAGAITSQNETEILNSVKPLLDN